eukprot:gene44237-4808_t
MRAAEAGNVDAVRAKGDNAAAADATDGGGRDGAEGPHRAPSKVRGVAGMTALAYAVREGHADVANALMDGGASSGAAAAQNGAVRERGWAPCERVRGRRVTK